MFSVYWVLANLPYEHRSSLQAIQLALLCKASAVKQYGYEKILHPLLQDLKMLEKHGVFVEQLGECLKGTVLIILVLIPWQGFKRVALWNTLAASAW